MEVIIFWKKINRKKKIKKLHKNELWKCANKQKPTLPPLHKKPKKYPRALPEVRRQNNTDEIYALSAEVYDVRERKARKKMK